MFENGFSDLAKEKLMEIISKNMKNRGFFEWDNKEGVGQGSDFYAGSAGSMGKALFEGYFGIKFGRDRLSLEPKLGTDSTKIHIYQPANRASLTYAYKFEKDAYKITLKYNSNFQGEGMISILNPWPEIKCGEEDMAK